jgi:hypothetical protein
VSFKHPPKNVSLGILTQLIFNQDEEEFVELMDGKVIKGDVTKCNVFKTSTFKRVGSGGVVIDGMRYESADVRAVQHKKNRYRKNSEGEFAARTQKGKISVYYTWTQNGSTDVTFYYIQKGVQGPLISMTMIDLREMVSDYAPAVAVLDNFEKQTAKERRKRKILPTYECIDVYNEHYN